MGHVRSQPSRSTRKTPTGCRRICRQPFSEEPFCTQYAVHRPRRRLGGRGSRRSRPGRRHCGASWRPGASGRNCGRSDLGEVHRVGRDLIGKTVNPSRIGLPQPPVPVGLHLACQDRPTWPGPGRRKPLHCRTSTTRHAKEPEVVQFATNRTGQPQTPRTDDSCQFAASKESLSGFRA